MLGIMILSILYDRELEPVIRLAFNAGRDLIAALDAMVAGSRWGQVAVNHVRERVNMTHVVLSLPAIVIARLSSAFRSIGCLAARAAHCSASRLR
jgi:hypothetical protein